MEEIMNLRYQIKSNIISRTKIPGHKYECQDMKTIFKPFKQTNKETSRVI